MQAFWVILVLYFSLLSVVQAVCSVVGCLTCSATSSLQCATCRTGFTLDNTSMQCKSTMCEKYQGFQQTDATTGNGFCTSICSETENMSSALSVCQTSQQCSQSYVESSGLNQLKPVKELVYQGTSELYLLYETFVNSFNLDQRTIERSFSFGTVLGIKSLAGTIYLFSRSNTLIKWDPNTDTQTLTTTIIQGSLKSTSVFITAWDDNTKGAISSFNDADSTYYLTKVATGSINSFFSVTITSNIAYFQTKYVLILQDKTNYSIQLIRVKTSSSDLVSDYINSAYSCFQAKGTFLDLEYLNSIFYSIYSNTMSVLSLDSSSGSCTEYPISEQPTSLSSITLENTNILAATMVSGNIFFYNTADMSILINYSSPSTLIQLILAPYKPNQFIAYSLDNSTYVSSRFLSLGTISAFSLSLDSIMYTPVLISLPSSLQLITLLDSSVLLGIVNQDLQILTQSSQLTTALTNDFKHKIYQNEARVSKLIYAETYNLIVTCSIDGSIIVWANQNTLLPLFFFQIKKTNQQCIDLALFKDIYAVVLLTNEIFLFNILNQFESCSYSVLSTYTAYLKVTTNHIYLGINNSIRILDSICSPPSSFSNDAAFSSLKALFVTQDDQIVILNSTNLISLYKLPLGTTPVTTYQNIASISSIKLFDKTGGGFDLIFYDSSLRMVIVNESLVETYVQIYTDGAMTYVYSLDNLMYFFILKLYDTTQTYLYRSMVLDTRDRSIGVIGIHYYILEFAQIVKKLNTVDEEVYVLVCILPLSYTTLVLELYWSSLLTAVTSNEHTRYGRFAYTPGQYVVSVTSSHKNQLLITGADSGQARILPTPNDKGAIPKVFTSLSSNPQDFINKIMQSFFLGKYFIATSSVYVYSMFTDTQLEVISFQSNTGGVYNTVIQMYASRTLNLFVACVSKEIITKDYTTNTLYRLNTLNQDPSQPVMTYISGFYLADSSGTLYIYGSGMYSAKKDLTGLTKISSNIDVTFQKCLFLTTIVACKVNTNQIVFYYRAGTALVLLQRQTVSQYLGNFDIFADEQTGILFAYYQIIEVYALNGQLIQSSNAIPAVTFAIYLCNLHTIVMTYSTMYVFKRATLVMLTTLSPSGGGFLGGLFLPQFNIFVYFSDEIRYGQAYFYSLDSYSPVGSVLNTFSNNGLGKVVKLLYDADSQMLNYIDTFGNNQNVIFSGQRTTDNTLSVEEIQEGLTSAPVDQILDFYSNTFYIHNGLRVWRLNYNLLTRPLQRLMNSSFKPFFSIETPTSTKHFIVDYSNNIIQYSDFIVTFSSNFNVDIINMHRFVQFNTNILLIVMKESVAVYVGDNFSYYTQNNPSYTLLNTHLKRVLLSESNRSVFCTYENVFVDYDFSNHIERSRQQLNILDHITAVIYIIDPTTSKDYLIYGTVRGQVAVYSFSLLSHSNLKYLQPDITSIRLFKQLPAGSTTVTGTAIPLLIVQKSGLMTSALMAGQVLSLDPIQSFQAAQPAIIEIQILDIDTTRNIYYLNFISQKRAEVRDLFTHNLITQLMFPDDEWKRLDRNGNFTILSAAFQLNIYTSDFMFVDRVRRYNRKDIITDLRIIDTNKVVVVFVNRIESLLIVKSSLSVTVMDTVTLTDPQLIYITFNSTSKSLRFIGAAYNQIFEKRVSTSLFETTAASSSNSCVSSITFQNNAQAQNAFELAYGASSSIQYLFQVHISDEIKSLTFLNKTTVSSCMRPYNSTKNNLNIASDTFTALNYNIQLQGFSFTFNSSTSSTVNFNALSQNVIWQDITISKQTIPSGTSIVFDNKSVVLIQNLLIDSVNFQASGSFRRNLENENQAQDYEFIYDLKNRNSSFIQKGQNKTSFQDTQQNNRLLSTAFVSSFFSFTNCTYVMINNLTIINSNFDPNGNSILISSSSSVQFLIRNLTVIKSSFQGLLSFSTNKNVDIQNITIKNCDSTKTGTNILPIQRPLINYIGIAAISINLLTAISNKGLTILETNKAYDLTDSTITLKTDVFSFKNSFISDQQLAISSIDDQYHILTLESSIVVMDNITFSGNQGNIFIQNTQTASISNSVFRENVGVTGSAVQGDTISSLTVTNCTFSKNQAYASGGAIYLITVLDPIIDNLSVFSENKAQIGGAIRLMSLNLTEITYSNIKAKFNSNVAEMFGNNIATFLNSFQLSLLTKNSVDETYTSSTLYQGSIYLSTSEQLLGSSRNPIIINDIQTGGPLLLSFKLIDQDGRTFVFDPKLLFGDEYSALIKQELEGYKIELSQTYNTSSDQNSNLLEIKGESLIMAKQFQSDRSSFEFTSLTLTSSPLAQVSTAYLNLQFHPYKSPPSISLSLSFRDCIAGEIYVKSTYQSVTSSSSMIVACKLCDTGTYSVRQENFDALTMDKKETEYSLCKKCPGSASKCEGSTITLSQGYWRKSNFSEVIVECLQQPDVCDEDSSQSINGCYQGYVGPLCETCDMVGSVWGTRYAYSFSGNSCAPCSSLSYTLVFMFIGLILVLIYLVSSVFIFMNSYIHNSNNSRCCYLRFMRILPFSKSSILDESTFFIKALMNYLQLSAHLFTFSLAFLPSIAETVPNSAGQPVSKAISSASCLYRDHDIIEYGQERLGAIFQVFYPWCGFFIVLLLLHILARFKAWDVGRYHKYTMINVVFFFFQPDAIAFLTKSLSCRNIGDESYQAINLLLDCNDTSYRTFSMFFILPNLIFWTLFPAVLFFSLRSHIKKVQSLYFCITKYKFGYFYLGFKHQFYYWEFVRIYFRTLIVVLITLLKQYGISMYVLSVILIFIYIIAVMKLKPFESKLLAQLEFTSYLILIPNIFFSQVNIIEPFEGFSVFIAIIHFGFIFYVLLIIVQFKLNNQNLTRFSRMLHKLCQYILPKSVYCHITKTRYKDFFKVLMRWRMIYKNLETLTAHPNTPIEHIYSNDRFKKITSLKSESIQFNSFPNQEKDQNLLAKAQQLNSPKISLTPRERRQESAIISSKLSLSFQDNPNQLKNNTRKTELVQSPKDAQLELSSQAFSANSLHSPPALRQPLPLLMSVDSKDFSELKSCNELAHSTTNKTMVLLSHLSEAMSENSETAQVYQCNNYKTFHDLTHNHKRNVINLVNNVNGNSGFNNSTSNFNSSSNFKEVTNYQNNNVNEEEGKEKQK